jgi:endonuclease I
MKRKIPFVLSFAAALLLGACASSPSTSGSSLAQTASSDEATSLSSQLTGTVSASSSDASSASSSASSSAISSAYYSKVDLTETGNTLRGDLATLLNNAAFSNPGKSALATTLPKSDADPTDPTHYFLSFYSGSRIPVGTGRGSSGNTWNNEHVWPDSRGVGYSGGAGTDPHMLRPTWAYENSGRGNNFFGLKSEYTNVFDPASYGNEQYRGSAARIIFYTATRYWKTNGLELSDNPSDATSAKTMGCKKNLLAWNKAYPVSAAETYRNEYLYKQYNVRNPFIDDPALADRIWTA